MRLLGIIGIGLGLGVFLSGPSDASVVGENNFNSPDCYCAVCPEHIKPECKAMSKIGISAKLDAKPKGSAKVSEDAI